MQGASLRIDDTAFVRTKRFHGSQAIRPLQSAVALRFPPHSKTLTRGDARLGEGLVAFPGALFIVVA